MGIPLVDLEAIHAPIRDRMQNAIAEVMKQEAYVLGPEVEAFEREIADFLGVRHAVGVSSGTDALLASLMALGIGRGDHVVTTPFTYVATATPIARLGARPVFCDVEADGFNMDPDALEAAITPQTRAIIVVHLFGRPADMDRIRRVADRYDVPVVEDAAQAIGAEWNAERVGGHGRLGCFSFFPAKNLGALGDGGLVTTQDPELADHLRRLRVHGTRRRYVHEEIGGNFRLDALQAAVLRVKLPELEGWTATRQDNAVRYQDLFQRKGLGDRIVLPEPGLGRHVWNQYVIRILDGRRSEVFDALREADIGCAVYYPTPLHMQPCFGYLNHPAGAFPVAEQLAGEVLALPIAPGVGEDDQERIVDVIAETLGS